MNGVNANGKDVTGMSGNKTYRSKRIVEAFQWFGNVPEWFLSSRHYIVSSYRGHTFHGPVTVELIFKGDFIINDNGRIFRLSPAEFAEQYEAVK